MHLTPAAAPAICCEEAEQPTVCPVYVPARRRSLWVQFSACLEPVKPSAVLNTLAASSTVPMLSRLLSGYCNLPVLPDTDAILGWAQIASRLYQLAQQGLAEGCHAYFLVAPADAAVLWCCRRVLDASRSLDRAAGLSCHHQAQSGQEVWPAVLLGYSSWCCCDQSVRHGLRGLGLAPLDTSSSSLQSTVSQAVLHHCSDRVCMHRIVQHLVLVVRQARPARCSLGSAAEQSSHQSCS